MGAHQPNRRLRLAAEPQTGRREVSALTDARKTLAYDFFRILRAPLLKTIETAQQEIRLMGYSFTSPEVVSALVSAKRRGVDVKVVLDRKANTGKNNNASRAAMNLLVGAGIPVRTVSAYKILHDKVIVSDGRHTEVGSFNYSRAADRSNSENVLVVWDDPVVAQKYLNHWASRWAQGTDWKQMY
ncbi:phospholipase D family protein [Salmonella enterica]|nr:phospholipase D family protein [Salmonella enterica]EBN9650336.1 phospholipase D family protein [Salmonella enterica]